MKLRFDITYLCVIWNTLRGGCAILTSVSRELAFLYQRHQGMWQHWTSSFGFNMWVLEYFLTSSCAVICECACHSDIQREI